MISFIDTTQTSSERNQEDGRDGEYLEVVEELEQQNKRILELMTKIQDVDASI